MIQPLALRTLRALALLPLASLAGAGCGGQSTGEAVMPADLTYAGATGKDESEAKACLEARGSLDTLVIDMDPADRLELETSMKDGVAVVKFGCEGVTLLRDCRVAGGYGFKGATLKEQVLSLTTADEVRANLPSLGSVIAADLSAEMQRGATLDVGLAMVGKIRSTRVAVGTPDLAGECDGATHFVRGATVGAFAMAKGSRGEAKAAATVFQIGASGKSVASRKLKQTDGELASCQRSSSRALEAPDRCSALLRLELKSLAEGAQAEPAMASVSGCPEGFVSENDKCVSAKAGAARRCTYGSDVECRQQCEAGSTESCAYVGHMLMAGGDLASSAPFFEKGCKGGNLLACHNWGYAFYEGAGVPKDFARAKEQFSKVCDGGEPVGCAGLALLHVEGSGVPKDPVEGARLYTLACNGGEMMYGCPLLGRLYERGEGVPRDLAKARELYERSCAAKSENGCLLLKALDKALDR